MASETRPQEQQFRRPPPAEPLVSQPAADASRERFASLLQLVTKPEVGDNTLEGMVREVLRPMLRDWLDAQLPDVVERLVAKEVARISGQEI